MPPRVLLRFISLLVLPAGLVGCGHFQSFAPAPINAAAAVACFDQRTFASLGIDARGPIGFPALASAAMNRHPDVEVALREADIARAAILSAGARPNPSVSFLPTRVTPQEVGVSPWVAGFGLDFAIETAGKRHKRLLAAQEQANAAALRATAAAWQVRSRLRAAWLEVAASERRANLLHAQLVTQESLVTALDARLQAGESSRGEMLQSRLLLNQTRILASGTQKSAAEARAALAAAAGLPASQLTGVNLDFSSLGRPSRPLNADLLRRGAFIERPDVLAALADYAAEEAALRLEIAKQYPDLKLGPGYEFDQGLNKWTLGLSLTLPVFDRNQGPIAEAEARRAAGAARFQALEARVAGELERALTGYRGALEKLRVANETVTDATKQRDTARRLLEGGEGDRLALLTSQVELDASLLSCLDVEMETQQALAAIEDATHLALEP